MPIFTSACPCNCYSTCSLNVFVEDGRIRRIEPHPANRATPHGVCLKGLSHLERTYSPERITTPLHRRPQGDSFDVITWEEALDLLSGKLQHFRQRYGPQSVLYYCGSGSKGLLNSVGMEFWRLYGGCTTTYGDLCWPAGLEATRLMLGDNKHNAPWDLENARLIVMWGKNAAETNVHQMAQVDRALEQGGRLVVIDPRRTESSERSELLIQPRPGTDGALALGVAYLLIRDGQIDHGFIDRHVMGFTEFSRMVQDFPPQRVAALTDVPQRYIHRLAELVGTVKPMTIVPGFGMQRYTNSGQTFRAMIALVALTGQIGLPGAGWMYANLQSSIFSPVRDPLAFYPPDEPDGVFRVSVSTARLGHDMSSTTNPDLKMAWVERGNPIPQNPCTNEVLSAFRALDFRVVIDQFLTDTAREADLVLPSKTMFEQTDIIGAYWHSYIQIKQKVLEPPPQVKPETEIYYRLALRMGFIPTDLAGKIPGPSDAEIEAYLAQRLAPFPGLTLECLRQGPVLAPGHEEIAFADMRFPTPSGKIELYSQEAQQRWGVDPLPVFTEPKESLRSENGSSPSFPLNLLTPNTKNRIHSQFNNLPQISQFSQAPELLISPVDAMARGLQDGDLAHLFNQRGSLRLKVQFDFSLKTGCVVLTNGWWITDGGAANFLSAARETDMGHGAAFHDNLVELEKA